MIARGILSGHKFPRKTFERVRGDRRCGAKIDSRRGFVGVVSGVRGCLGGGGSRGRCFARNSIFVVGSRHRCDVYSSVNDGIGLEI
jgi:hypothetical protein